MADELHEHAGVAVEGIITVRVMECGCLSVDASFEPAPEAIPQEVWDQLAPLQIAYLAHKAALATTQGVVTAMLGESALKDERVTAVIKDADGNKVERPFDPKSGIIHDPLHGEV